MIIYTDGSAHPNPGPGGFGVVILDNDENLIYNYSKQTEEETTNNREELKAILYAMLKHGSKNKPPTVYSDSAYCVNTFTNWMFSWQKNGWIKSTGGTPENLDLIQSYYEWYEKGFRINLQKIKGHAGHEWNEMADKLATGKIKPNNYLDEVLNKY
jgi:ribonuclease HI